MYAEFNYYSFLNMSNSEPFFVQNDQKVTEFKILKIPTLESEEEGKCNICYEEVEVEKPGYKEIEVDDNDDGFRTPTSLEHKIPTVKKCPPAPRKPKPSTRKRIKASSRARRHLQLDLAKEIESMFPLPLQEDFGRKIKKARMEENISS